MKRYIIEEDKLQAILSYLGTRPYTEVVQGIQGLVNLEEFKESEGADDGN